VSTSFRGRRRRRRAGGILAIAAIVAAITASVPAEAAGATGPGPFGLTPSPTSAGQPRAYFKLTIAPGRSARDTAIVTNEGSTTERLKITVSEGVTAANSGSAFEAITGECAGASCWVTGLPVTVTLAPGVRKVLAFGISVPSRTRPGQYLAGITAESAGRPHAVTIGSNGKASARAIIIDQVTVGVAVTVGTPGRLKTALLIRAVSAGWVGSTPRLYIPVHNSGQTFVRATGNASCRAGGRRHSYRVIVETVLPDGGAVLPINAPGLASGSLPCTVRLLDGAGPPVVWSGVVSLPAQTPARIFHPANGVYISLPESTVPPWAVALIVIGALILASLLVLLVQRRNHPDGQLARHGRNGKTAKARPPGH
jgi:hypothetical protein